MNAGTSGEKRVVEVNMFHKWVYLVVVHSCYCIDKMIGIGGFVAREGCS